VAKLKTVFGVSEAKAHFSDLLDRVEQGERLVITRNGRAIAVLASPELSRSKNLAEIGQRALDSTKGTTLPEGMTIRDLIYAGRKR